MSGTCTYPYNFCPISDSSFANYLATLFEFGWPSGQPEIVPNDNRAPKGAGSKFDALFLFHSSQLDGQQRDRRKLPAGFVWSIWGTSSISRQLGGRNLMVLHSWSANIVVTALGFSKEFAEPERKTSGKLLPTAIILNQRPSKHSLAHNCAIISRRMGVKSFFFSLHYVETFAEMKKAALCWKVSHICVQTPHWWESEKK